MQHITGRDGAPTSGRGSCLLAQRRIANQDKERLMRKPRTYRWIALRPTDLRRKYTRKRSDPVRDESDQDVAEVEVSPDDKR
jgi:hypothetical protein